MGNYLGKKKTNPNLIDESEQHNYDNYGSAHVKKHKKPTIYRPQIFIDYYKSKLFKVSSTV